VVISQGGRFGGWTLYFLEGRPCYQYNWFGLARSTIRADEVLPTGRHEVRVDFAYDGGGVGRGGRVTLSVDGRPVGQVRVERTIPYYFSFDETLDVGVDLGTPTSEDYAGTDTRFTGTVRAVHVAAGDDVAVGDESARERRVLTSQ
jgi:arylsulfatase